MLLNYASIAVEMSPPSAHARHDKKKSARHIARRFAIDEFVNNLELELRLYLNHARRGVASQERSQNAGRRVDRAGDVTKTRSWVGIADVVHRQVEVRVVQEVESLRPDGQLAALPPGEAEALRDGEVRVEIPRPPESITALVAESGRVGSRRRERKAWRSVRRPLLRSSSFPCRSHCRNTDHHR